MSKRRVVLVLVLLIGAVAAVPVVALAWRGGSEKLLIGFELHFTGPTTTAGTFQASGAVDDSGETNVTGSRSSRSGTATRRGSAEPRRSRASTARS